MPTINFYVKSSVIIYAQRACVCVCVCLTYVLTKFLDPLNICWPFSITSYRGKAWKFNCNLNSLVDPKIMQMDEAARMLCSIVDSKSTERKKNNNFSRYITPKQTNTHTQHTHTTHIFRRDKYDIQMKRAVILCGARLGMLHSKFIRNKWSGR